MSEFMLKRLGLIMEPEPGNPQEIEGVLNPAAVRGPDGKLYLFPRLVARGNYSRIGIARVLFNAAGDPFGVERLGIALEPETDYERRPDGSGGCEDPRITFVEPLRRYMMTYTALSPQGPRIALAVSEDLFHWKRLGLAAFAPYRGIDFVHVDDKDASIFPTAIPNHSGKMQLGILHRPLFPGTRYLVHNNTIVLKFFLHISKEFQEKKLMSRLETPDKHWKFSEADLSERKLWDSYQKCYSDVLSNCSTKEAPWYVVPANHRWFRDYLILKTIVRTIEDLKLEYPELEGNIPALIQEVKESAGK
jgi:hypothetical protein